MSYELLTELSEEELAPPDFYPIEYALMWVAYGNQPINHDYAKIIYNKPPTSTALNSTLQSAEKKLLTYLRSGKISTKTMEYKKNKEGNYVRTGKYVPLEREAWKGDFDWYRLTLNYSDSKGSWYECTDIVLKTAELIKCEPLSKGNAKDAGNNKSKQSEKSLHVKERETLLKLVIGMAADGYGYDPSAARSPVPKEISDILTGRGMSLDPDTVRKWLKEAAEFLPKEQHKTKR